MSKTQIVLATGEVYDVEDNSQKAKRQQRDPAEQEDIKNRIRRKMMDL